MTTIDQIRLNLVSLKTEMGIDIFLILKKHGKGWTIQCYANSVKIFTENRVTLPEVVSVEINARNSLFQVHK